MYILSIIKATPERKKEQSHDGSGSATIHCIKSSRHVKKYLCQLILAKYKTYKVYSLSNMVSGQYTPVQNSLGQYPPGQNLPWDNIPPYKNPPILRKCGFCLY